MSFVLHTNPRVMTDHDLQRTTQGAHAGRERLSAGDARRPWRADLDDLDAEMRARGLPSAASSFDDPCVKP